MYCWVIVQQIGPKLPLLQGRIIPTYPLAVATKFDAVAPDITVSSECNWRVPPAPFWRLEILKWLLDLGGKKLRYYRYAPHNDVPFNDATHIRR